MSDKITIAVSKGRIFDEALPLLAKIDVIPKDDPQNSRKLILETNKNNVQILVIRATDVPTYVERGAAELGIAGKDVLLEYQGDGFYEPIDLGIAKCKMMLAGLKGVKKEITRPRIATKYTNITQNYFSNFGKQVEIIKLYGSMELAPILGLADQIVDLVDTGKTLEANGLVPYERIADISSRLIVNKASMKLKSTAIKSFIEKLSDVIEVAE
ncbi:MAG: ATP phosphoribosyltransferase [Legionellales bacterium]|jgi:ATP phosphoribosyltransferase|nr:ATP phosphoribosyltransferase [Legionellales bacterium]|tara:strand:- start:1309 stop:1947 length:639 start_codon:yes stop_codon:yes gene_type:complete